MVHSTLVDNMYSLKVDQTHGGRIRFTWHHRAGVATDLSPFLTMIAYSVQTTNYTSVVHHAGASKVFWVWRDRTFYMSMDQLMPPTPGPLQGARC